MEVPPETTLTPAEKAKILAAALKNTDKRKKASKDFLKDKFTKVAMSPTIQANKAKVQILGV